MRPPTRLYSAPLFLLSILFLLAPLTLAAEDELDDEYEEHARVMRISLTQGEVSLRRAGNIEWERAQLNLPLVEGDVLSTGRDSRVEAQVDARNFVRVGADSVLKIVTLREEGIALSLSEGTASLRLARFDREREYFEIDAPGTTIAAEKTGLYRLDVATDGKVSVTVRDDGRARIYSETSGFVLRNNRTAKLYPDGQGEAEWDFAEAAAYDFWDAWNDSRERHLASRLRYDGRDRYYDADVWGAEELDAYGDWTHTREYGYLWRPHVTIINNYHDWAPYRYGHWRWCPPYGWTWVPDEEWGWAPYHHGRWVYYNNNWCWAPRGYGYAYRRAWWRPALVAFVYIPTSYGEHIAWYPLRHGQRDPRGRHWRGQDDRREPRGARGSELSRPANPALLRAVTTMRKGEFGSEMGKAKPASNDIAQRTLNGEPVRGSLPVTPPDLTRLPAPDGKARVKGSVLRETGAGARPTLDITRPAPNAPARPISERPTGAIARTPGVALDEELRRLRVFKNREPRISPPSVGTTERGEDNTGVVARPAPRPLRSPGAKSKGDRRPEDNPSDGSRVRPTRPDITDDGGSPDPSSMPEPRARRKAKPDDGDGSTMQPDPRYSPPTETRPADPRLYERPEPRVKRKADPDETPQPRPPRREEPPSYQPEPPAPREERPAPRITPPPRDEPPPAKREPPPPPQERPSPREERPAPPPQRDSAPKEKPDSQERPAHRPSHKEKGDQP
jgi:hypothetical protein